MILQITFQYIIKIFPQVYSCFKKYVQKGMRQKEIFE